MGTFKIIETIIGTAIGGLIAALIIGNLKDASNFVAFPQLTNIDNVVLTVVIISLILAGVIYGLKKRRYGGSLISSLNDYRNYHTIATVDYLGVKWEIAMPYRGCDNKSQLRVKIPPRCPKCQTELEQKDSRIGGYVWRCVRGDFKKHNKRSYWFETDGVEKIARRLWEEGNIR